MSGGSCTFRYATAGSPIGGRRPSRMNIIRTTSERHAFFGRMSGGAKLWHPLHVARASFSSSDISTVVCAWPEEASTRGAAGGLSVRNSAPQQPRAKVATSEAERAPRGLDLGIYPMLTRPIFLGLKAGAELLTNLRRHISWSRAGRRLRPLHLHGNPAKLP